MVKDRKHRTRALALDDGRTVELMPQNDESEQPTEGDDMDREKSMGLLRLITAVQDEAHRFAGQYNKTLMKKRQTRYTLEDIKGVGPARRKAMLRRFGSLKAIAAATEQELAETEGMSRDAAAAVRQHFDRKEQD